MKLCLARIIPPKRERPVVFDLPTLSDGESVKAAVRDVIAAVAAGQITVQDAKAVVEMLDKFLATLQKVPEQSEITRIQWVDAWPEDIETEGENENG